MKFEDMNCELCIYSSNEQECRESSPIIGPVGAEWPKLNNESIKEGCGKGMFLVNEQIFDYVTAYRIVMQSETNEE